MLIVGLEMVYRMKRVLIISYCFPPSQEIGGLRPYILAKFIKKYGYEPIVITKFDREDNISGIKTIRTDEYIDNYNNYQPHFSVNSNALFRFFRDIFSFPDYQYFWKKRCLKKIKQCVDLDEIDIIFSTSSPITCHLIARHICQEKKIPWVADLRDLWYNNHYENRTTIRACLDKLLEMITLNRANYITSASESWTRDLKNRHEHCPVETILTGFNPEEISNEKDVDIKFSIMYGGGLYGGKRDPSSLFQALSHLIELGIIDRTKIEINFYSERSDSFDRSINEYHLSDVVFHREKIPRQELLKIARRSQLLLILLNNESESGVIAGKIFEYLASKRPILCIGPNDNDMKKIIIDLNVGIYATNQEEIARAISDYYREYIRNGYVEYRSDINKINQLSGEYMAKRFAQIFDELS